MQTQLGRPLAGSALSTCPKTGKGLRSNPRSLAATLTATLSGTAAALLPMLGFSVATHAQGSARLAFVYTHQIDVNCQSAVATQSGWIDPATGTYGFDFRIKGFIPGYRWEVASPVTLATSSACPIAALEVGGAKNLLSLTGGDLNFSVLVTLKDAYVDLRTEIVVRRDGDIVRADLHTRGTANLPDLLTIESPIVLTQTPNPGGGFTERGIKVMVTEDGKQLASAFEAVYTGVNLPGPQTRVVNISLVDVAPDHSCGRLNLVSEVRPASTPTGPELDIAQLNDTTLRLQWQYPTSCSVEKSPTLYGAWAPGGLDPACDGDVCEVTDAVDGRPAYYRLHCDDGTYSPNVAAYLQVTYPAGLSLVSIPLPQSDPSLNSVLALGDAAADSLLYRYSAGTGFRIHAYLGASDGWFPRGTLQAGEGAFLLLSAPAAVNFVSMIPYGITQYILNTEGLSLIGWPFPPAGEGTLDSAGFPVRDGDLIYQFNGQSYASSIYIEGLGWLPAAPPAPDVGEGFWFLSSTGGNRVWNLEIPSPQK